MKKYLLYIIGNIILFSLIPFFISKIQIFSSISSMVSLMFIIFLLAILSLSFGKKHGFSILLPVISFLIFLISALVQSYAPTRIFFYAIIYMVVCLIGNLLGLMFRKKK